MTPGEIWACAQGTSTFSWCPSSRSTAPEHDSPGQTPSTCWAKAHPPARRVQRGGSYSFPISIFREAGWNAGISHWCSGLQQQQTHTELYVSDKSTRVNPRPKLGKTNTQQPLLTAHQGARCHVWAVHTTFYPHNPAATCACLVTAKSRSCPATAARCPAQLLDPPWNRHHVDPTNRHRGSHPSTQKAPGQEEGGK